MTKIVVSDDEPDVLDSTLLVLEMHGYEAVGVGQAKDEFDVLLEQKPDVLLQDVYMPGLDLAQFVERVRTDPRLAGMKVLVFTASTEGEMISRRIHADGYIRKPFEADKIRDVIERTVGHARGGGDAGGT